VFSVRAAAAALGLALIATRSFGQAAFDVDRDGTVSIYTDLVYVARYLLGLPPVPESFRASGTPIPPNEEIRARIEAAAGTPRPTDTPPSTATHTATFTATRTDTPRATDTVGSGPTVTITSTRPSTPTRTPGTPSRTPTASPTFVVAEGSDVVRAAAEVSVQNPETIQVIGIGCASIGGCQGGGQNAFRLAAAPRTALRAGAARGPRGVAEPCMNGIGTKTETCTGGVQTIVYDNCTEPGTAGHTNTRDGRSILTVNDPQFCDDLVLDLSKVVTFELRGPSAGETYVHVERNGEGIEVARLEADWADLLQPDPPPNHLGCRLSSNDVQLVNGRQSVVGTMHFRCRIGALDLPCPRGSTDVTLSTASLDIRRDSGGFPCELGLRITGDLRVEDLDRDLNGRSCRTAFTQTFDGFLIAEAPTGMGSSGVRQEGRMTVDAFGPLLLETRRQEIGDVTPGPGQSDNPASIRFVDGSDCPLGPDGQIGDGEIEVRRPPLVDTTASQAAEGLTRGGGPATEFRQRLYRATNGQVYQVLQNVNDLSNFGSDALQITTLAASEAGAVGQCSFTAGAEALPQAVAAIERTMPFPVERIFKSALIRGAAEPTWNRNGGESQGGMRNDGAVCIGPGCLTNAVCPAAADCVAFTIAGPGSTPITQATSNEFGGIPGARLVEVPRIEESSVGCLNLGNVVTLAFGSDAPTIEIAQCSPFPSASNNDGFRLPNGFSIVIAYQASFSSLFNAAVAGFPIDTDNNNIVCPAGQAPRVLHLGESELGSVEAPTIRFQQSLAGAPQVVFDFLGGDPAGMQTVTGCVGISRLTTCE
jgi:hypothetical protein